MEESSNGKLGEMLKVETGDWDKEVSVEFKTVAEAEAESVRVIVVHGNPELAIENRAGDDSYDAEPNENSTQEVDSGKVEEDIIVRDSVVGSVEPQVFSPSPGFVEVLVEQVEAPHGVADELESMVIEDNILQSLDETKEYSKLIEETIAPSSDANDDSSPVETEVVSKAIEEIPLASLEDECEVPPATADVVSKAIEGTNLSALEQNPEESSGTADLESKKKFDESSLEAANSGSVGNNPEIPASTDNQPVTSLSQLDIQPTSWRSCCGLIEVLRRSDR